MSSERTRPDTVLAPRSSRDPLPQLSAPTFSDPVVDTEFRRQGYVVVPLLDPAEVARIRDDWRRFAGLSTNDFFTTAFLPDGPERRAVYDILSNALGDRLARILPRHAPSSFDFIVKKALSTRGVVPLHQDWSFVDTATAVGVNMWCALQDTTPANGCLKVVPGSHAAFNHICAVNGPNPSPWDSVREALEKRCSLSVPMKSGEAFFWNQQTLHASGENGADADRIVASASFIPKGTKLRFHDWKAERPGQFDVYELEDMFAFEFTARNSIHFPNPNRVRLLGTMEYSIHHLTLADVEPFVLPDAEHATASPKAAQRSGRGFVSRLFGR